jgi:multidrug resistance protein
LGVKEVTPLPDINVPSFRRAGGLEFPEEYELETQTGLVPSETLSQVRTHRTAVADIESNRETKPKFVTFTIDDPENPRNWTKLNKWIVTGIAALLVVSAAFGSSNVTGGIPLIEAKYNVSQEVAFLTCSIMVFGFAVGPLVWAPLSEVIGRRPVYIISLSLYTIFNIPCALAPNIGGLLASRFLCGVFGGSVLSLAGGTIADIWDMEHRGLAIAYFAAAPYCGPVLGPLICGWIHVATGRLDLISGLLWPSLA